jgi:hypothetical protein
LNVIGWEIPYYCPFVVLHELQNSIELEVLNCDLLILETCKDSRICSMKPWVIVQACLLYLDSRIDLHLVNELIPCDEQLVAIVFEYISRQCSK